MVTQAQQRESISKAQERARQIARTKITKRELLKQTLSQRIKRQIEEKRKRELSQKELSKISKYEKEFEAGVSAYEAAKVKVAVKTIKQRAWEQVMLAAQGKRTMVTKELGKEYAKFLQDPKIRAAVESGQSAGLAARKGGFSSVQEYFGVSKALLPVKLPSVISQAKVIQPSGTYDPKTGSYISPEGVGMSIRQSELPTGTKIIGETPQQAIQRLIQPEFETPEQEKVYQEVFKPFFEKQQKIEQQKRDIQKIDIKSYKDMGFTPSQAQTLADEGWKQKASFTPEGARQVLRKDDKLIKKVGKGIVALNVATWGAGGVTPLFESGIIEKPLTGYTTEEYKKLESSREKISTLTERITTKYEDKIKDNEFIGTEAEYKQYKKDYEKLDLEIEKFERKGGTVSDKGIEMPTTKIGDLTIGKKVILKGREVPLEKFEGLFSDTSIGFIDTTSKISGAYSIGAKQMFFAGTEAGGKVLGAGLTTLGVKKIVLQKEEEIEEKQIKSLFDWTPRKAYSALKGNVFIKDGALTFHEYTRREVSLEPKEFGTQLGRATGDIAAFGATTAKYAVPVAGGLLYGGEVGGSIYESGGVGKWIKEKPVEAALTGAVVLGGGAFVTTKWLKTPIVKKIPSGFKVTTRMDELMGARVRFATRESKFVKLKPSERYLKKTISEVVKKPEVSFLEVGQKTIKGEEVIQKSYPIIVEQPAIIKETTLFSKAGREMFKEKVSKIIHYKYKQPKIISPFADKLLIGGKPFVLRTTKISKTGKIGEPKYTFIGQESKFVPFEEISKLSKVQQYTLLKTLEKGKLSGRLTRQKDILKYLKEEEQIQMGVSKELGITKPIGKQTSTFEKVAIVEEVKPIGDIKVYDVMAGAKDVSKAYPRAIGDVSLIKGKYLELPPIDKTPKDVTTIITSGGKRTPLSSTFELQKVQALKYIPKKPTLPKPTIKQTMIPEPIVYDKQLPYMVGGTGLQTSQYTGQGIYEVQEGVGVSAIKLDKIIQPALVEVKQTDIQIQRPSQISMFKEVIKERQREIQRPFLDVKPIQVTTQPLKEVSKIKQLFKQALQLKQTQKQKLAQRQALQQIQKQALREVPIKPKIKIPFKLKDAISKVTKMAKEKPQVFEAWGKKFGKEVKLGTFKTKIKAEEKLSKFIKKELSAAGFITKDKKKLKAKELSLLKDVEFRKSKLSEFLIIERKEKRLRKTGTGKDIQYFRSQPLKGRRKGKSLFGI